MRTNNINTMKKELMSDKIKLSLYFRANKSAIIANWKDEFFREKHNNELSNYINAKVKRAEVNCFDRCYLEADITIANYRRKLTKLFNRV